MKILLLKRRLTFWHIIRRKKMSKCPLGEAERTAGAEVTEAKATFTLIPRIPSTDVLNARDQLGKLVPEIVGQIENVTRLLQDLETAGYEAGVLDERGGI
jgi:hypothetical protein